MDPPSQTIIDSTNSRAISTFSHLFDQDSPAKINIIGSAFQPVHAISYTVTTLAAISITFLIIFLTYKCCPSIIYKSIQALLKLKPKRTENLLDTEGPIKWFPDDPEENPPIIFQSRQANPQKQSQDPPMNNLNCKIKPKSNLPPNIHIDT